MSGTTESRPISSSGERGEELFRLDLGEGLRMLEAFAALTRTMGTLGSVASTLMTVPVPTAVRSSPVW